MEDFCIVVRSVRERTEEACLQIVRSQLGPGGPLYVVRDRPFAEAHIESMRLAVEAGAKWSLFLDADVLLRRDALADMLREAEAISQPFYMLNFRVLDRGFGGPAYGVHLYATEHLRTALKFADLAREAQRPETRLCIEMAQEARVATLRSAQVVGLHGYEQFYADLYRTSFVRAVKFVLCRDYLLRRYRDRYETDADDRVMFWGLVDGMVYGADHETAPLDKEFYRERASRVLVMLGLEEKGPLTLDCGGVEQVLRAHVPDEEYLVFQHLVCPAGRVALPVTSVGKRVWAFLTHMGKSKGFHTRSDMSQQDA
jgi:hypothetical protein